MAATATISPDTRQLPGARSAAVPGEESVLALRAPRRDELLRRLRLPLAAAVALVAALLLLRVPVDPAVDVARRLLAADHGWLLLAVALEACSFAGYVLLLGAVAGRAAPRFGVRDAYRTTVAGAAATRLLPTAGAGGAALTLWVLRRAGAPDPGRTLAAFLAVLYSVFLVAVLAAGVAVSAAGRPEVGALPAALAAAALVAGALLARAAPTQPAAVIRTSDISARPGPPGLARRAGRPAAVASRLRGAPRRLVGRARAALGPGIADGVALVRTSRDPRLLGAFAWWAFDIVVLGAALHAVGGSIALGTLALAYLLGQVANTVPLPGSASTGLVGVLILLGTGAATAVAAVLCYRVIAVWLPAPAGLVALGGLRGSVARWREADRAAADVHAPQPLAG